jgi:2-C-methyl-D-erythritol 4-phosphate cytidylyltransferase/2-C-methyl-D-erythritol 2,4-cyclodiphosphate synthase
VTGAVAIILAAGTGERLRQGAESVPKAFKPFSSRETMLSMSVRAAAACPAIGSLIVTVPPDFEDRVGDLPSHDKLVVVIPGGESRQLSVSAGLRTLGDEVASVVCHDAARPFASSDLFAAVLAGLDQGADGVVPVVAVPDTVKRVEADAVVETVPRQELRLARPRKPRPLPTTPPCWNGPATRFASSRVKRATSRSRRRPIFRGRRKFFVADDLRVGLGFDTHPRDDDRLLYLAGVLFTGEPGLSGHSDADVVCHAVGDALLGAAVMGDLGEHFPDDDPAYAGAGGLDLLRNVVALLEGRGLVPVSCDATLIAERPNIGDRKDEMRAHLAAALDVPVERVSVKATRPEGLGLTGDGAGCIAIATVAGEHVPAVPE